MKSDEEILESAILGGLIGAALGSLINEKNGAEIGALAGAVILASSKAYERARETDVPVLVEEKGILYEITRDGSKTPLKKINKYLKRVPKRFDLE
jgi:hypothetical protein